MGASLRAWLPRGRSAIVTRMIQGGPIYEMLWDCRFCGQKKLLGVTHRFCASCGAPQDPAARYFPPDHEKVAVQGHPYVGADVACPACRQPMARLAKCCTNCGSPLDRGAEVARRPDVVVPPPGAHLGAAPGGAPAKTPWALVLGLVGGVFLLLVTAVLVVLVWKRDGAFQVAGHSWERTVAIERYESVNKRVWCDDVPSGARVLSRRKEKRGTREEVTGETCVTRKKDLGTGAYEEIEECKPKVKRVPKMDDRCEIEVNEWRRANELTETGSSLEEPPRWPAVRVSGGACLGCEREGKRTERYTVELVDVNDGSQATCDVPEAEWARFARGSKWKGKIGALTGRVDCEDLTPL